MTAGGRRRERPSRRGWGKTYPLLPPEPPPEGIDLVIQKHRIDDPIVRASEQQRLEAMQDRSDLDELADSVSFLTRSERDRHGRIVVNRRDALIGAVIVALVAGFLFWLVATALANPGQWS